MFFAIAAFMAVCVVILFLTIKEKKLGAEIVTDEEADDVMQPPFGEWKAAVVQTV